MRPRFPPSALCVTLVLLGAQAPAGDLRGELEALAVALESAVGRVSHPSRSVIVSRGSSRGYHLPGYGAIFVLPPRALPPRRTARAPSEMQAARALAEAARRLEESLKTVESKDVRQQIEQSLTALRRTEAGLRLQEKTVLRESGPSQEASTATATEGKEAIEADLQELDRRLQAQLALPAVGLQAERARGEIGRDLQRELESQIRAIHEQAEAFRLEAEKARAEAEREIRARLGSPAPISPSPRPGADPSPNPTEALFELPSPPWQFWLEPEGPAETVDAEGVVQEVRTTVARVLEREGWRLRELRPDELVVVAVDFIPGGRPGLRPRVERTLVVRVSKRDIDERRQGRLPAEEFRKRVEFLEY